MRVMILYASHYGQTRVIAQRLAEDLKEHGADVDLFDARFKQLPAPDGYDVVVFGSRIEVGRHASSVTSYIRANRGALEHIPTAFFSVSMAAAGPNPGPDPNGYLASTFEQLAWKPTQAVAFAGGLPYRKYGWLTRFIMKRISQSANHTTDTSRNHVFTNWTSVRAFAEDIASLLPGHAMARRML